MQSLQMKTVIKLNFYRLSYHPSGQHSHADADAEQAQGQNPHFGIHWLNIK